MTRYIASESNLKMMMNLLRDKSKNIQFEAFHVFKVRATRFLQTQTAYQFSTGVCSEPEEAATNRGHPAAE